MNTNLPDPPKSKIGSLFTWTAARRALIGLAMFATLLAVFYAEENWRGKRAWKQCKRDLGAQGEVLDWSAYIPAPIADEQNIFKAPKMAEWLVRKPAGEGGYVRNAETELTRLLNAGTLAQFVQKRRAQPVAEITFLATNDWRVIEPADLLLRYEARTLHLATTNDFSEPQPENIPLIQFVDVSLTTAIQNLARQANLHYQFDPKVLSQWSGIPDWRGTPGPSRAPLVSFRWENLSAHKALFALLDKYGLAWIEDPATGIARISTRQALGSGVIVQQDARERLKALLQHAFERSPAAYSAAILSNVRGRNFVPDEPPSVGPVRLVVSCGEMPDAKEVADFFPRELAPTSAGSAGGWRAELRGSNIFQLFFTAEPVYSAADYLAWSDRFAGVFKILREALHRPLAHIDGDYRRPFAQAIPDFVGVRVVAQSLAERAQCYLLLGQPEHALEELTMLHNLRRVLAGKPTTLVAAMIDVAVSGLYTSIIADGFRLAAWRDPELLALQKQLREISLPPAVLASLQSERAAVCQTLLNLTPEELDDTFRFGETKSSFWGRVTDPVYLLIKFAPHGWIYQNMVTVAVVEQSSTLTLYNSETQLVVPSKAATNADLEKAFARSTPYNVLARLAVPNFTRAMSTAVHNQTTVNQALVACGLERYRRAHGDYPDALDALLPQFVEKLPRDLIGGQPLHYQRTADGKFVLYSIGWNETDDGGKTVFRKDGSIENDGPDWVWQVPAK